jgi:hypothetical protein
MSRWRAYVYYNSLQGANAVEASDKQRSRNGVSIEVDRRASVLPR